MVHHMIWCIVKDFLIDQARAGKVLLVVHYTLLATTVIRGGREQLRGMAILRTGIPGLEEARWTMSPPVLKELSSRKISYKPQRNLYFVLADVYNYFHRFGEGT